MSGFQIAQGETEVEIEQKRRTILHNSCIGSPQRKVKGANNLFDLKQVRRQGSCFLLKWDARACSIVF